MSARLLLVYLLRGLALVLGLPSLLGTLYFGWGAMSMRIADPGGLPPAARSSNQLVQIFEFGGRAAGTMFQWLGNLGEWLMTILCVLLLGVFLFAVLLWVTSNGLEQDKLWARIAAAFCLVAFVSLLGIVAAVRGFAR